MLITGVEVDLFRPELILGAEEGGYSDGELIIIVLRLLPRKRLPKSNDSLGTTPQETEKTRSASILPKHFSNPELSRSWNLCQTFDDEKNPPR